MKKICVIGNSHLASIKLGWDSMDESQKTNYDLTFFGTIGKNLKDVYYQDGEIVSDSEVVNNYFEKLSGGKLSIVLDDYDYYLIVGLEFNITKVIKVLAKFRSNKLGLDKDYIDITYVSDEFLNELIYNVFNKSTGHYIYSLLHTKTDSKITVIPQPFPSPEILSSNRKWSKIADSISNDNVLDYFIMAMNHIVDREKVEVILPGEELLVDTIFTKQEYCNNSVRLDLKRKHQVEDFEHMNSQYGKAVLLKYFNYIS